MTEALEHTVVWTIIASSLAVAVISCAILVWWWMKGKDDY